MPTIRSKKNPIIPNRGVCDPHIHIFKDKAYLYATHDADPDGRDYRMHDWQIWSSPDLVEWTLESTFRPEDTYIGPSDSCWATDAAERNGKYFFYFSNGMRDTGVAVSDYPGGPFRDALGKPLLPENLTPTRQYDPAVFIDDDEQSTPYIIFGSPVWAGGDSYYIATLNEDMVSLKEAPTKIILNDPADDKPFLHKHNGIYYLSWASFYAISNCVTGPYHLVGNTGASPDHGSFFEWNGQWFNAFTVLDPTLTYRATGICYVHYRNNGEMLVDPLIIEYGVGHYDARWTKIEAEWYMAGHQIHKIDNPRRGIDVKVEDGS
jgi:arabinoxylan arabinofuranohydrolase